MTQILTAPRFNNSLEPTFFSLPLINIAPCDAVYVASN
jgi:hypothetical protein